MSSSYALLRSTFELYQGRAEGCPAFYVRADEWDELLTSLPDELTYCATRLSPGAVSEKAPRVLRWSNFLHEREWRTRGDDGDPVGFRFQLSDVAYVLVPSATELDSLGFESGELNDITIMTVDRSGNSEMRLKQAIRINYDGTPVTTS